MKLLSVASEVFPVVKTGGLADVAGALPAALAPHGIDTLTLVPGYPAVAARVPDAPAIHRFDALFGGPATLRRATVAGLDLLILDAPHLYARPGTIYGAPDDALRFAALARAAADVGFGAVPGFRPDVVHSHDWQTGLTAAYLAYDGRPRPGTVATIHNLAFQGQFPAALFPQLGLPPRAYAVEGIEYYGGVGYLKAALYCADRITTVSPTYATEIRTSTFGMGMDGLLRHRAADLHGILNGIDTTIWDPAADPLIATPYTADTLPARAANKAALQSRAGLPAAPDVPLLGAISRFSWQKGIDLILDLLPQLADLGAQLVLLGAGDDNYQDTVRAAGGAWPGRVGTYVGYDEGYAHLVQAGADSLLVPSRFEPCGLTQLCALRYGAVPIVARTGGLADTVIDASPMGLASGSATGVQFAPATPEMLAAAVRHALSLYADKPTWRRLQHNGMTTDVSWRDPARRYAEIFRAVARPS